MKQPADLSNQFGDRYYELEALVDANHLSSYTNRIRILENSLEAIQLGNSVYSENRRLLVDAMTAIARCQKVIISTPSPEEGIIDKDLLAAAELEYLDHRSALNENVIDTNEKLAKLNKQYADILEKTLALNDELIEQCSSGLEKNSRLAQNSTVADDSMTGREGLLAENEEKHALIVDRAILNQDKLAQVYDRAEGNREVFSQIKKRIETQQHEIQRVWSHLESQQELCFEIIDERS